MEVYKGKKLLVNYNQEAQLMDTVWLKDITDDIYTESIYAYADCVKKYEPHGILIDFSLGNYTVTPDKQNWTNQLLDEIYKGYGKLKKVAFVVSEDLFTTISVEQMVDDITYQFESVYFKDRTEAMEWLAL